MIDLGSLWAIRKSAYNYSLVMMSVSSKTSQPVVLKSGEIEAREAIAWDIGGIPETGPSYQPWRAYWPPPKSVISALSAEELKSQPWLTWKRDPAKINDKPWYSWVNVHNSDIDKPCDSECPYCEGKGCVSLTIAIMNSWNRTHITSRTSARPLPRVVDIEAGRIG